MPELPEVENVRRSLLELVPLGARWRSARQFREDLRWPLPEGLSQSLEGQHLLQIRRRAKILIFETDRYLLLNHLGMTGSWRRFEGEELKTHDHLFWQFDHDVTLVFNDPRRFGYLKLFEKQQAEELFKDLGPEPLSAELDGEYLFRASRGRAMPMKSFLLNQKIVAGLGNIYVSEALFRAGVRPRRWARTLKRREADLLAEQIKILLNLAITRGGSTIRDYRQANGQKGGFQDLFQVYDREGKPCRACGAPIAAEFLSGRSTYWCRQCQE